MTPARLWKVIRVGAQLARLGFVREPCPECGRRAYLRHVPHETSWGPAETVEYVCPRGGHSFARPSVRELVGL